MTRMPFGKHAGLPLGQIPVPYLNWVLDTVDLTRYPGLRRAIKTRLALADYEGSPVSMGSRVLAVQMATWVKQRVDRCYREMALKYHPDRRGGSTEAMVAVNTTFERLRESLELE